MRKYYYILNNIGEEQNDLKPGVRILEKSNPYFKHPKDVGEGAFNSLKELRAKSEILRKLEKDNPKRARRIFEDRFIIKAASQVFVPLDGSEYTKLIYPLMQHSSGGKVKGREVLGVHLFHPNRVKIVKKISHTNKLGIWQAYIMVYNRNSKKWIPKSRPSTFFPVNWTLQELVDECRMAYNNRKVLSDVKHIGATRKGIPVIFIIKNGKLKSVYPHYDPFAKFPSHL